MIDEDNLSEFIRKRLKSIRETRGYTVNSLAYRSGISQSYIRCIEIGEKKGLSISKLFDLCLELDVTLTDFFNEEFAPAPISPLLKAINSLDASQQETLLQFIIQMQK